MEMVIDVVHEQRIKRFGNLFFICEFQSALISDPGRGERSLALANVVRLTTPL